MKTRNRFISLAYLIFLVLFIKHNITLRENADKIANYDRVKAKLEEVIIDNQYLESDKDCLTFKTKILEEWYNGFGYTMDWNAVERNNNH